MMTSITDNISISQRFIIDSECTTHQKLKLKNGNQIELDETDVGWLGLLVDCFFVGCLCLCAFFYYCFYPCMSST